MTDTDAAGLRAFSARYDLKDFHAGGEELAPNIRLCNIVEELVKWFADYVCSPFWEQYKQDCLDEELETASRDGVNLAHGLSFIAIWNRLFNDACTGHMTFSNPEPQGKSGWGATDHLAHFILQVADINLYNRDGSFYGQGTIMNQMWWIIWQAYLYKRAEEVSKLDTALPTISDQSDHPERQQDVDTEMINQAGLLNQPTPNRLGSHPDAPIVTSDSENEESTNQTTSRAGDIPDGPAGQGF
ncbi:hypothetical protein LTR84_000793 [Exophiala bonariae]|uniref:Uncharacterized protein n=1 Tax=Exophiala bonariae TaxID=1690606 RepID=A0AAV9NRM9_9EURO|nr:hypothetical protein LTR84_000793 [Exophiala bonariae]